MAEKKKKGEGRRPQTRFWIWAEQWLLGSTRTELANEERAVLIDFFCLAAMNGGCVECFSRDQFASQLCIERELLDRCIEKFLKTGKIGRKYNKREKKEIFYFIKWEQYQPEYLWKKPYKSTRKGRSIKPDIDDAHVGPKGEEKRKEEKKGEEMREDESHQESQNEKSLISHIKSSSLEELLNEKEHKLQEFLSLLRNYRNYPFNKANDAIIFVIVTVKHPYIDIIYQLKKKIEWWEKKASPAAVKSKPRTQLLDHFERAFNKKVGPEKVGDIAEKFVISQEMKDQIAWLENEIRRNETKNKKENLE